MHPAIEECRQLLSAMRFAATERAALSLIEVPMKRLEKAPPEERIQFVIDALTEIPVCNDFGLQLGLKGGVSKILRGKLTLDEPTAIRLLELVSFRRTMHPYKAVVTAVGGVPITPAIRDCLVQLRPMIDPHWLGSAETKDIQGRIDELLNGKTAIEAVPIVPVGPWTALVFATPEFDVKWQELFRLALTLTQSSASIKWQSAALKCIERIGRDVFQARAEAWLALGPTPGITQLQASDEEATYQKGLIWAIGACGEVSLCPAVADFALACFRKIPQLGAVSQKAGNACVNALAIMPGLAAVAQLNRLSLRVKYDVALRLIEKALAEAAVRNQVSREDLEAMSVPTFDLVPAENEEQLLEQLKSQLPAAELKKVAKDLKAMLAAQRLRIERLLSSPETMPFASWREWYLDHPLTSLYAKRLIWQFASNGEITTAIWHSGSLRDWANQVVTPAADARARLWHPIESDVQTVLSWRCWLEDHPVVQPFKQAHREVYILTAAEELTATYSNRFASHLVRQHQFAALCRERGWQFKLMGQWDSHNNPTVAIPAYELRAELEVDFPPTEESTAHMVYLLIATGRLRFTRTSGELAPLDQVPPVVFSEIMRDVDLFIGVTSIGSDPDWPNQHPGDPHLEYWEGFAFGELTASADHRKQILASLLPKLAIAPLCRIEGHFLHVRGHLHEYRIHLGSGNVMIHELNRYLCIVQGPGDSADKVRLPFEGDRVLSSILSKAILLTADHKIKDETIRRQL